MRELRLQDPPQSVEVGVFAADSPAQRLRRDRVQHVVGREEAALAHLRIDHSQSHFVVVDVGWDDLGRGCPCARD